MILDYLHYHRTYDHELSRIPVSAISSKLLSINSKADCKIALIIFLFDFGSLTLAPSELRRDCVIADSLMLKDKALASVICLAL